MALQKAHLTIPLGFGVETSVDDKLLPVGKTAVLENAIWSREGEVIKRPGSGILGSQYAAGTPGTMPPAWQLATHKGALVTLSKAGPRPIGVYSPKLNKWIAPAGTSAVDAINGTLSKLRGQVLPQRGTVYRSNALGGSTNVVQGWDFASNGTYMLVGWVETNFTASTSTIKAQILEIATGKTLFWWSQSGTFNSTAIRCIFTNSELRLVYVNGANLKYLPWSISNLNSGAGTPGADVALSADATATALDVIEYSTDMMVIYGGSSKVRIVRRTTVGVNTVSDLLNAGSATIAGFGVWMRDLLGSGILAAQTVSASGMQIQWSVNRATGATSTTYTIDGTVTNADGLSSHTISSDITGEFVVLWSVSGATQIKFGRRTVASGITTGNWIFSARLASQTFLHGSDFYVQISYVSPLSQDQNTLFAVRVPSNFVDTVDGNRTPSARYCTGSAFSITYPVPPNVYTKSTDVYMTAAGVRVQFAPPSGTDTQFNSGVDAISLTFNPANVNTPREFADGLYVCGGALGAFDGRTFAEEGFHLSPEPPTVVMQAGGNLGDSSGGNYEWCAIYRYTDDNGRIHRSAPSIPALGTATASNRTAQVTVTTLKLHGRPGGLGLPTANGVVIELYRTAKNEKDTFQLVAATANDDTIDTVVFTDAAPDTSLGQVLYTTGGVLESQSPPPALAVATYKDRLAVISAEDPTLIWVSLPLGETEGPRFNDVSSLRIDDSHGNLTGLGVVDDRLIAFKRDAIYAVVGDGPDVNGNGSFGIAQIIASGIGASEARSIAQDADGVSFRSVSNRDGYFRVNRGLAVEEFGNEVQKYLQTTDSGFTEQIADAVHIPEEQRTKVFTQLLGTTLVYDHSMKHWSVETNQIARAACAYNGGHVYQTGSNNLQVVFEDTTGTVFDDSSSPVEEYVESPWVSLADLKGYERFYRVQIAGEKRFQDSGEPGYKVTLYLYANFDTANVITQQSKDMLVTDDINATELRYSSKFSAIKLGIRIGQRTGDTTNFRGPKLTALTIEYGTKQGFRKIDSTKRTA